MPITRADKSDPRWAVLDAYVREIAERMGLHIFYYEILLSEPEHESAFARTVTQFSTQQRELAIDWFSLLIAPQYPLPVWPEETV